MFFDSANRIKIQMQPKVSIIVPVYNASLYLKECITSLINQSIKEIEIIFINDGSKDNSLAILQSYAQNDSRIKIINQTNQGAGPARNNGIKQATGQYLICLDADDFFEKNMLEQLYITAQKEQSDRVVCGFYIYNNQTHTDIEIIYPDIPKKLKSPYLNKDVTEQLFNITFGVAWIEMYRTDLIKNHNILFGNWSYAEDSFFVWQAIAHTQTTSYLNNPFVHYRFWNKNQATLSLNNQSKISGLANTFAKLYNILIEKNMYNTYKKAFSLRLYESIQYELDNGWGDYQARALLSLLPQSLVKDYHDYLTNYQKHKRKSIILS